MANDNDMIGTQYSRSHKGYEGARLDRIFNRRRPEKYPSDIIFAASSDDGEWRGKKQVEDPH